MAIPFDDYLGKLPKKQQQAIKERAAGLIAEEATLRQLREARARSQEDVAAKPHVKQTAVSKLERRTDMDLSTSRGYIEAMGGKLEIIARFPDQAVRINQFQTLDPENRPQSSIIRHASWERCPSRPASKPAGPSAARHPAWEAPIRCKESRTTCPSGSFGGEKSGG